MAPDRPFPHAAGAPWWQPPAAAAAARAAAIPPSGVAFAALVAFTAILLLSPQAWFPLLKLLRIAFIAAATAIVAHVVERTIHRQPITPVSPEIALALALVAWSVVTVPLSYWPGGSVRVLVDHYLKAITFFWLLGIIVTTRSRLQVLAWTLVLCSIPLAATALHNYVTGDVLSTGIRGFYRVEGYVGSGLAANPNDLALMLNLLIPLAFVLTLASRGLRRLLAAAALVLGVAAVIVTFSRAGFLTLAAVFVMAVATLVRRRAPGAAALLVLAALAVPPLLPPGYVDRLRTIADIDADATGSAQGRWQDFVVASTLVAENPVIGVGIGQDILALNRERGEEWTSVHNAYLQYAVDLGVPGLALFVWLHLLCYRRARHAERLALEAGADDAAHLARGVQMSLVAFGVGAMFHPIAYQFYFFCVGGLAVALGHACRIEPGPAGPATRQDRPPLLAAASAPV